MDNSMCHSGHNVTDEFDNLKLDCVPHPPYSPDPSPCDFWLFEMLKRKIKDQVFQVVEETMTAVHKVWDELTLEDLQSILFNWIERLEWVIEHEEKYTQPDFQRLFESLSHGEIKGSETFSRPIYTDILMIFGTLQQDLHGTFLCFEALTHIKTEDVKSFVMMVLTLLFVAESIHCNSWRLFIITCGNWRKNEKFVVFAMLVGVYPNMIIEQIREKILFMSQLSEAHHGQLHWPSWTVCSYNHRR
jgi:hypothetical protein